MCEAFPREPTRCPALPPASHAPRSWAHPRLCPPLSRTRGAHHRGQVSWRERTGTPLLLLVVTTRRDPKQVLGVTPTHLYGAAPLPRPSPPGARGAGRGASLPAHPGGHRCYGGPPCAAPSGTTLRPSRAQGPEPHPGLGAVARRVGRVARLPPARWPVDGHWPLTARNHHHNQPPTPPPPRHRMALPSARHECTGR